MSDIRKSLAHVLWLGGATEAGKTTVTQRLAEKYGLQVYHYDRFDVRDHERLAAANPARYGATFTASVEENWLRPTSEDLAERSRQSFRDRLPFVLSDLLELPTAPQIIAEGFGLTPDLIAPFLSGPQQALWLLLTPAFKRASMKRRGKPVWAQQTRNPERAFDNLYTRDMLLAETVKEQAQRRGFRVLEVDGSQGADELAAAIGTYFALT